MRELPPPCPSPTKMSPFGATSTSFGLEEVVGSRRAARLAERQQHLAVRAELDHLVSLGAAGGRSHRKRRGRRARRRSGAARRTRRVVLAVDDPDVAVAIDGDAVREDDEAGAEALDQLSVPRRTSAPDRASSQARVRAAALADPDADAVLVDVDRTRRAPRAPFGQLRPAFDGAVGIRQVVVRVRRRLRLVPACATVARPGRDGDGGQRPPDISMLHIGHLSPE